MRKFYLSFIMSGIASVLMAQTITIKDTRNNKPLQLVTLLSEHPKAYGLTNSKGQAEISEFKGSEKIEIRSLGYKTEVFSYSQLDSLAFEVFLERAKINLDEIVISATRWRQTSTKVPSKVISVKPREIDLQNPQTAADLLGISGKVYIQKSQQGGGSPMIRGFATNRLLYTVDGVRMNTAIFRGGNIQNVISLDPFAAERTEILFGPGSVIYGSDAIGGVMSFQTLSPKLALNAEPLVSGKAVARYSSANDEKTGHFDIRIGTKKWAFVTSISSFDYGHLKQGTNGPEDYVKSYYVERQDSIDRIIKQDDARLQIPSAYSQMNLMQKVRFKPGDNLDLNYGFHYSETSSYGRYDRHNRMRNGLPRYAEWNYGPQKWMMNQLSAEHSGNNVLYDKMTLRFAQQFFEESRIDRDMNDPVKTTRTEKVDAYSLNFDLLKNLGQNHTLYYGLEYVFDDVSSSGTSQNIITRSEQPAASRYPESTWMSLGIYINNDYKVSDRLSVQAGLRYNHFLLNADFDTTYYPFPFTDAELNNGALTGSIGGVYRPSESWVISSNFATAFRSPNVDDIGKVFDSEPGAVVVPNPDLKAEYAYNFDLGLAKKFNDLFKIDLTGYYTNLQNALVRRDYSLGDRDSIIYDGILSKVQSIQNAAVANVYGIQAGLELKLPKGLGFTSDLNIQVGEEELDDGSVSPSRHAAPVFGVSRLTYDSNGFFLELYSVYQAERKHEDMPVSEKDKKEIYALNNEGNTYAPAWYTLNFKAMVHLTDLFTVSAGIENITDQRYRPYSSGISGPGRNFFISLRADF